MRKLVHECLGFGLVAAFFGACAGIDDPGQFIPFAFGVVYGRMVIRTEPAHD
jgi:hypothetical protein